MYYPKEQLIIEGNFIIDIKTGQKFQFKINRKIIWRIMDCFPEFLTQEDIQKAEQEGITIQNLSFSEYSEEELRIRRIEIGNSLKKVKKVIYSFI